MNTQSPRFYAGVSVVAALGTIVLKFGAYLLTGSVGLFSDAAESLVNLLAALIALWALTVAARPPDDDHMFGHSKAEYFASGMEGALILIAAGSISVTAWNRLFEPQPLEALGLGLVVAVIAAALNGGVALVLLRASKRLRSITLEADARHLLTDVWTTAGVVLSLLLVRWTGWLVLDSLVAFVVAANIVWIGARLLRETGYALLDRALPPEEHAVINAILERYEALGVGFHAMRSRRAGLRRFISLHVLVPGTWTVQQGHDLCEEIELSIVNALPESNVLTHLEPIEDPSAWADQELDRAARSSVGEHSSR